MSAPKKIRGDRGPVPPQRALKLRSAEEREWAYALGSSVNPSTGQPLTTAEVRKAIKERLGISLGSDSSYSDFRSWQLQQRQWDRLNQIAETDEERLTDQFPGLSREKLREATIKRSYAMADLLNDPEFTLKVIKTDQGEESARFKGELDQAKLALARESEARARKEHELNREKFEFDAATAAKKFAAEIKTISANPKLNESQKINAIRAKLFGALPATTSPTQ
jgi:hypothetical protein